ncbi:hypothetical protein [Bradyrhizobium sp. BR 10261]|uniref:hypothetical protein n=1 Tax=Bradyrhizobium sp. BR 10261 TaxID=2749992 RepID=UPI001C654080|nr:hypothetical protein [Bradyrhizobium sp. BR 10261]MBW7961394.1 hypothetical protein [Bradyrhizobium sp. BR 10261]
MTQIIRYLAIDTRTRILAERLWGLLDEPSDLVIAALVVTLEKYVAVDMALTLSSYSDRFVG